jgi:hypothetical protein
MTYTNSFKMAVFPLHLEMPLFSHEEGLILDGQRKASTFLEQNLV